MVQRVGRFIYLADFISHSLNPLSIKCYQPVYGGWVTVAWRTVIFTKLAL